MLTGNAWLFSFLFVSAHELSVSLQSLHGCDVMEPCYIFWTVVFTLTVTCS